MNYDSKQNALLRPPGYLEPARVRNLREKRSNAAMSTRSGRSGRSFHHGPTRRIDTNHWLRLWSFTIFLGSPDSQSHQQSLFLQPLGIEPL
jgi:hypothetical protein